MAELRKRREPSPAGGMGRSRLRSGEKSETNSKRTGPPENDNTRPAKRSKTAGTPQEEADNDLSHSGMNLRNRALALPASLLPTQEVAQSDLVAGPDSANQKSPQTRRQSKRVADNAGKDNENIVNKTDKTTETAEKGAESQLVKYEDRGTDTRLISPPSSHTSRGAKGGSLPISPDNDDNNNNNCEPEQEPDMKRRKRVQDAAENDDEEGTPAKRAKRNGGDISFTFDSARSIRSTSIESAAFGSRAVEKDKSPTVSKAVNGYGTRSAIAKQASKGKELVGYDDDQKTRQMATPSTQATAADLAGADRNTTSTTSSVRATESPVAEGAGGDAAGEQQKSGNDEDSIENEEESADVPQRIARAIRCLYAGEHACFAPITRLPSPGLHVKGVGILDFPPSQTQVKRLIQVAFERRVAGLGPMWTVSEALTSNKPTWMFPPSELNFTGPRWDSFVRETAAIAVRRLGAEKFEVEAKLHGLFVWEANSLWRSYANVRPHRKRLATLFISLPSKHTGGDIAIGSAGNEFLFKTSEYPQSYICAYQVANYDCLPVTSGVRIGVVYELYSNSCTDAIKEHYELIQSSAKAESQLLDRLCDWINNVAGGDMDNYPLLLPLQGQYRADALALTSLGPADRAAASAVHGMAEALDEEVGRAEEALDTPEADWNPRYAGSRTLSLQVYLASVTRRQRLYGQAAGGRQAGRYAIARAVTFEGASKPRVANLAVDEANVLDPGAFDRRASETAVTETMANTMSEVTCIMMVLKPRE